MLAIPSEAHPQQVVQAFEPWSTQCPHPVAEIRKLARHSTIGTGSRCPGIYCGVHKAHSSGFLYFTMTPAPKFAGLRYSPIQQVYQ
ncbi:hypothetical protein DN613_14425 [Aeromonas caviae]|nr:hypothetical protein DN613_14425 [Aeromonas caviae]